MHQPQGSLNPCLLPSSHPSQDVLAGRKTGGVASGDVRVNGFPKNQRTFARVMG